MEIRLLRQEDMGQARALWEACFEDYPAFLDWYFHTRFQPTDGLGIFLDGRLLSDLHLSPRRIKLRNKQYPSAYLLALATAPSFRHLGLARTLLTYTLRHLAANQIFFTFLLPFNTEFYTRLGWGVWADHRLYILPSVSTTKEGHHFRSQTVDSGDWSFYEAKPNPKILAGIYEHSLAVWDGGLVREQEDWTCLLLDHTLDGGQIWLGAPANSAEAMAASKPQAYALVLPDSPCSRPLLRELAWTDPKVKEPFLRYLITRYANAAKTGGGLSETANNPGTLLPGFFETDGRHYNLTPYFFPGMQPVYLGRITSVRLALEALTYPPLTAEWTMAVTDPLLPENSGLYHLKLTKGKMGVTKTTGGKPALRCSVGALASLIAGRSHPQALIRSGELALFEEDLLSVLEELFPPTRNFVNEYF